MKLAHLWLATGIASIAIASPDAARSETASPLTTMTVPDGRWHELAPLGKLAYHEAVYDAKRQYVWIFGGRRKDSGPRDEVWVFDLSGPSTLSREVRTLGPRPSPRTDHVMILDTTHDRLIVFGGNNATNDVWALSLTDPPSWQQLLPTGTAPSVRIGTVAVYDSLLDRMMVFGGRSGTNDLNDVWALSLGSAPAWTHVLPAGSPPPPRYGHGGAYDPIGDRLVIAGGWSGSSPTQNLTDVWALSLSTPAWTQLSSTGISGGAARVIMDPLRNRLIRLGGPDFSCSFPLQAFSLSPTYAWTTLPGGGGGTNFVGVYDAVQDRLLTHGGVAIDCSGHRRDWHDNLSAYSFATGSWSSLTPSVPPRPSIRTRPIMAAIPARNEIISVGGLSDGDFEPYGDVWRIDLTGTPVWQQLFQTGSAPDLVGASGIYDPVRDQMVFFGGAKAGASTTLSSLAMGTTPIWSSMTALGAPPLKRSYHSAVYDPVGDRMIVFGGYDGGYVHDDLWQLTLSPPMTWSQLFPPGLRPGPRYAAGAIYDPLQRRMLVFGGNNGAGGTSETWALSLGSSPVWTQIFPAGAPPTATTSDIPPVYDPNADRMLYLDGNMQTWELSLSTPTWTLIANTSSPPGRSSAGAAFDANGHRMLVFAGRGSAECFTCNFVPLFAKNDLWILETQNTPTSVEPGAGNVEALALRASPNPSRLETTLEFDVPTYSAASLRIYDVTGRLVRELVNGPLDPGPHQVRWDGRDAAGAPVGSGLYFVRARIGDVEHRRTIVRIR